MNEFMSSYDRSPQGLKMICFWAKVQNLRYLRYSFWIENSSHSEKLKISLITKYPLTWGMQRRKVQLTLEEESFTGFSGLLHSQEGRTYQYHVFLLFRFLVQITISEYKWQKIYPLFPSLVERKFSCGQVWMNRNWSLFQLILLSWPTAQHGDSNSDQICFFPLKFLSERLFII